MEGGALKAVREYFFLIFQDLTGGKYGSLAGIQVLFVSWISLFSFPLCLNQSKRWTEMRLPDSSPVWELTPMASHSLLYPPSQNTPGTDQPLQTLVPGHTVWFQTLVGEERQRAQHKKVILGSANTHISELPLPHPRRQTLTGCHSSQDMDEEGGQAALGYPSWHRDNLPGKAVSGHINTCQIPWLFWMSTNCIMTRQGKGPFVLTRKYPMYPTSSEFIAGVWTQPSALKQS